MPRFDATIPVELQLNDYSCSVAATYWCLRSLGLSLAQQDLETLMVPRLVSQSDGLLDGSGATIAQLLRDHYGLSATNTSPLTFDQACARAGQQPLALGGARWYVDPSGSVTGHWVAVRSFDGSQLVLANPGGTGPHFGQQTLTRSDFEQRAPFAAVWIDVTTATGGLRLAIANTDGQGANLRPTPDTDSAPLASLPEGTHVTGDEHAWRHVSGGYLANEFLTPTATGFVVANTGGTGVNLRTLPEVAAPAISVLPEGTHVSGDPHAWRHVKDALGNQGWVADEFLANVDADLWTFDLGLACSKENYWDPNGQPNRQGAMLRFNRVDHARRLAIFEAAMDAALEAEGISDGPLRDTWKQAMRKVTMGDGFPGECPDLNPFMLAGELGGVFRGGADVANSSALGYFQFISQKPIPVGTPFSPEFDYGHWKAYGPCEDYAHQTEPASQVRQFIRAVRASAKYRGDPNGVVQDKATPPHTWGP